MWFNFHTHSNYCDGKGELMDYVAHARSLNMVSLGFSSHAPLPFARPWSMPRERLSDYLEAINRVKASTRDIQIYAGLEVDFVPNAIRPTDFSGVLDYTVGSVHFVDVLPDGTPWEIDGTHTLFLDGFEKIFDNNIRATLLRYFELTRQMIKTACPTVVGHLDKIKIQNTDHKLFHEEEAWYREAMDAVLDCIADEGAILEVNTRGQYQKKSATPYPSPWVLERALQKNIRITLSSDAHHPDDITNLFGETAALLAGIGFKTVTVLHDGSWQPYSFTSHGITLR